MRALRTASNLCGGFAKLALCLLIAATVGLASCSQGDDASSVHQHQQDQAQEQASGLVATSDWPMWRFDAQRRAATPMYLADNLQLHWVLELATPSAAWPAQMEYEQKLDFDRSYSPVVEGQRMFVASMVNDSLTAYDTRSGQQLWRFYSDGPMRFAPTVSNGKVYAASDDGHLYCLNAEDGALLWKLRGGPDERRLLGNGRLISMLPVRGAPVERDGTVYFAASIWPLMGTFIHAVDASSGRSIWCNSGSGSSYNLHQHGGANAFGGVAPQGYLAADETTLVVPGGLTVPASYHRQTGELQYFNQGTGTVGKGAGGYRTAMQGNWYYNHGWSYSLEDGAQFASMPADVLTDEAVYVVRKILIEVEEPAEPPQADAEPVEPQRMLVLEAYSPEPSRRRLSRREAQEVEELNRLNRGTLRKMFRAERLWQTELAGGTVERLHLKAGKRLYGSAADGAIMALEATAGDDDQAAVARVVWQAQVEGEVFEMLAADDRLYVVTRQGHVYCFGPGEQQQVVRHADKPAVLESKSDVWAERVAEILGDGGSKMDYAVMFGVGSGRMLEELLAQSRLHVVAVDPDAGRVAELRREFDALGLYGSRVAIHVGDALDFNLPAYMAALIVSEDVEAAGIAGGAEFVARLFHALRPYGGRIWLPLDEQRHVELRQWIAAEGIQEQAAVASAASGTTVSRPGALPNVGQWSHQYGCSANSTFSPDDRVRAPLGLLWFGGPSNEHILPRHGQGPVPQVVEGRVIVPGVETLSARCAYTGRELWVKDLPGIGHPFTNLELEERFRQGTVVYMTNLPGANYIGSPFVSVSDGIYVRYEKRILRLDVDTGETLAEFSLPADWRVDSHLDWGHISVWNDLLITTVDAQFFDEGRIGWTNYNATSSNRLLVMNRYTGEVIWSLEAEIGFRHNTIISSAGRLYLIDGLSDLALALLDRRGVKPEQDPAMMAFDIRTGRRLWRAEEVVFGTWLSYSPEHDIVIQAGRRGGRGEPNDEVNYRTSAHRGSTGELIWDRWANYSGPLAIAGDRIYPGKPGVAVELLTGEDQHRYHPLTGEEILWTYSRSYGCGTQNVSTHLMAFRSGAAGVADLTDYGGTANLSGFRSGCTNNLVAADGVLNAPDYTRTCTCSYQNQTSLGLVHMADVEYWTTVALPRPQSVIRRVGVNLGAPGNRMSDSGTLWVNRPQAGARGPGVNCELTPAEAKIFRMHSSMVRAAEGELAWVAASGAVGLSQVSVVVVPEAEEEAEEAEVAAESESFSYTVRLHFLEPVAEMKAGERVFEIRLQGESVLPSMDVVAEAGGALKPLVKEFCGVMVQNALVVDLLPKGGSQAILSGIEMILEDQQPLAVVADLAAGAE